MRVPLSRFPLYLVALLYFGDPAFAADTQPGDACTVANQVRNTGGAESGGTRDFLICNGSTWTSLVRFSSNGNVGIGTTAPSAKLQISGNGTGSVRIGRDAGCGSNYSVIFLNDGAENCSNYNFMSGVSGSDKNLYINTPSGNDILFRENNVTSMIVKTGGKIGIGTASPSAQLDVNADASSIAAAFRTNPGTGPSAANLVWLDNIHGSGNYKNELVFGQAGNPQYTIGNDAGGDGSHNIYVYDAGSGKMAFFIDSNMNVSIGAPTAPAAKLHVGGEAIIGNTGLTCAAGTAGAMRYNSASFKMEYCDGTAWTGMASSNGGQAPAGALGDGYFVITTGTWNGNLGGLAGADSLCLTDLTNNDWKGKSTASANGQLVAGKVKAFLCNYGATCNNATPLARYFFAASGQPSAGGAYFDTDASGNGPGNSVAWNASNYFNTSDTFWTGRGTSSADYWSDTGYSHPSENQTSVTCDNWISASQDNHGCKGKAASSTGNRWIACEGDDCQYQVKHLVCLVNP